MDEACKHYRFDAWRVTQLDALARLALMALETVEALATPPASHRAFGCSYSDQQLRDADRALRAATRRLAFWALAGARTAQPEPHILADEHPYEGDSANAETATAHGLGELLRRAID